MGNLLRDTLENGMATHSSVLAWESHGQRSLVGYRPRGRKESDMTERLGTHALCDRRLAYRASFHPLAKRVGQCH